MFVILSFHPFPAKLLHEMQIYNPGQNIWNKLMTPSKIGQDWKSSISTFTYFLTAIDKVQFLDGRLATGLSLHPNLKVF